MTRLDQLIQRIEDPIKVSTEDAMDVVKQYWDEAANTVSSYWNDTDTEVAEEIGIPKPTLSQLLDQHGNGTAYANTGGNSGVDSYVTGEDWILVNFTTGAKYLYTHKSTTYENIEQMKRYASEGRGLNSFIMRISKDGYAGRNIKGNILIRPGMEHYRQQANKRLQLLYAFRNARMSTVSNEGIGDMISSIGRFFTGKDEHGVRKEDMKPGAAVKDHTKWYTPDGKKEWDKLADTMKRFYMNPNWIDNQTLVTGTVDGSDISAALVFNGQLGNNPLGNVDKGIQYRSAFAKSWYPHVKKLADQANKIMDQLEKETAGAKGADEAAIEKVRQATKVLEALPEPLNNLPKPSGMGLGNLVPIVKKRDNLIYLSVAVAKDPKGTDKLPALNKEQIKHACELILKLLDWDPVIEYISWPDFGDGSKFVDWIYDADNDAYMDLYDRFSQQGCDQIYMDPVRSLINTRQVAAALEKWIDRSIQSKSSNEQISNKGIFKAREVYMHNTINAYQAQLTKAGADGLDVTARQFMAIGLESMTPTETSPLYLPASNVASLEGVWDSIKDFFAGRPTKIHLTGGDRGLRAKLDRTINDRTWLSRQKYTLGEVNFRALPDFSVATARKYVQDYKMAVNSTSQHNTREMAKIRERLAAVPRVISLYAYRDMKDTSLIEAAIMDINPYLVRLNINIQEPPLMSTEMSTQTGQALTKVEVKDFAELVAQVHAVQSAYESSIWVDANVPSMSSVQFRYAQKPNGQAIIAACQRAVHAYQNVVLMVNREIKQRVTTHAAWINAENIADSLVNYIGKSITNVTTNSFESFNAPIVLSNDELKAACETITARDLSVSNEGIWGAVKYLFGGNYENLPKINAAYDEAVDAVKSTYANPQWVKGRRLNTDKPIKIEYFSGVAANPAKAFEKVKQLNHEAVTDASNYVKEEVEYLSKFTKVLTSGDDAKIKALLDMFEVRKPRDLTVADEADFDDGGTVKGLSQEGILKAAEVFIEAVKYRRTTDALYSQGMYKLMYTDSGKVRYGNGGEVTSKLNGPAKELAIKIGESADNVEKSFFNAFTPAWDNVDGVVRGTLMILEASAK